jgi:hypothetical protein
MMTFTHKWILTTLALIPFAVGQMSHATPFYKWVDEQGATHYTQTPPPQKVVKKVVVSAHIPADSANTIKNLNTLTKTDVKENDDAEKAADKAKSTATAEAERRAKNAPQCQQLRASLTQLQSGKRLHESDAKGERSYVTEAQKATQIQQANTQIQKECP